MGADHFAVRRSSASAGDLPGDDYIDALLNTRGKSRVLLSDFDNPNNASDSSWGSSTPLPLEYLIAGGDSGGGLFINVDGIDLLAGVHSFGWGLIDGNPGQVLTQILGFLILMPLAHAAVRKKLLCL